MDTLRVELDSLHMTNDQLAQEARREILGLKDEMTKMKRDYDEEIARLQERLEQLTLTLTLTLIRFAQL